jgi:hypothetical protein
MKAKALKELVISPEVVSGLREQIKQLSKDRDELVTIGISLLDRLMMAEAKLKRTELVDAITDYDKTEMVRLLITGTTFKKITEMWPVKVDKVRVYAHFYTRRMCTTLGETEAWRYGFRVSEWREHPEYWLDVIKRYRSLKELTDEGSQRMVHTSAGDSAQRSEDKRYGDPGWR